MSGLAYPVLALVRDDDAGLRALGATRRLVRLVSEFDPASYAVLDVASTDQVGRLALALEIHGRAAGELTAADLTSALGEALVLGDPRDASTGSPVGAAFELVAAPVAPMFRPFGSDDVAKPDWALAADLADGPGFAAPVPNEGDSAEALLAALARSPERVRVRTYLGPADELGARMAVDALGTMTPRHAIADYVRVPVNARTIVVAERTVPIAVRAALRQRGAGVRLVPVASTDLLALWQDPVAGLRSAAVGETHAVALTRVPAAGTVRTLGIATVRPAVPEHPLDPMPPAPDAAVRIGLAHDAYGRSVDAEFDVTDLLRHCYIEGRSGSGKTATIAQLFRSVIHAGAQAIYLDPHGDGAARAAAFSTEVSATTHYVRHGDRDQPVRMNPLAEVDAEARERAMTDLLDLVQNMLDPLREGMVGERFKRTFAVVADAAYAIFGPRTSITDVLALVASRDALRALTRAAAPTARAAAARLETELLSLGDKELGELVSWFVSRLQPFLRTPALRAIIGTGEDSVDLVDMLDSGANLIVDLAAFELGEDIARVLGALWLLKLRGAMGARESRHPVILFVDEAHLYTFGALPGLLAEARKFGIGVVIATQAADNLPPRLARAIEANCGSAISLRTGIATAPAGAARLGGADPRDLTRLSDLTAVASLSRGGVPTDPFTLHIDHFEVAERGGWTDPRLRAAADAVAEQTADDLWAPFAALRVLEDPDVVATVASAARRAAQRDAHRRSAPPHPEPSQADAAAHSTDGLLDSWVAGFAMPQPAADQHEEGR